MLQVEKTIPTGLTETVQKKKGDSDLCSGNGCFRSFALTEWIPTHESGQNVREAGESGRGGREEAPNLVVVSWKQVQAIFFLFLRKGK